MHEYIRYFQIAVDDAHFTQVQKSGINVSHDSICFFLRESSFFAELCLEIALVAKLSDYIAMSIAGKYFIAFEDIRVVEFFENVDL